jgi:spermidine synthase
MNATNINLIVQDGRLALAQSRANYSVICVDAYRLPYIPWHLTTVEFFSEARDHLEEDGVLVINVGRTPKDRRLVNAISGTLRAVFPSVHVIDVPNTFNSVLVATLRPTQSENLSRNLAAIQSNAHPFLIQTLNRSIAALQPTPKSEIVFTDDHAPVERLTNSIMMAFLLDGGLDNLLK